MKALVAYFSATGKTASVAKKIADIVDGDIFEIVPEILYTREDLNWRNKKSRTSVECNDPAARPAIASHVENIEDYDTIFVGFPIWWYCQPNIINTFLEEYDFAGKTIVPFATSAGSGFGKTGDYLKESAPGANILGGEVLGRRSTSAIASLIESLDL